jgi:hypothetical protein
VFGSLLIGIECLVLFGGVSLGGRELMLHCLVPGVSISVITSYLFAGQMIRRQRDAGVDPENPKIPRARGEPTPAQMVDALLPSDFLDPRDKDGLLYFKWT